MGYIVLQLFCICNFRYTYCYFTREIYFLFYYYYYYYYY